MISPSDRALLTELLRKWREAALMRARRSLSPAYDAHDKGIAAGEKACADELESTLSRLLAQEGDGVVALDRRDLYDFIRGAIKQALCEPRLKLESEAWQEAHNRTVELLLVKLRIGAASPDAEGEIR